MLVPERISPPGGQRCAGEQVAGLRAVDVPLQRLGVVEAADEEHLLAEVGCSGASTLPSSMPLPCALGPPLLAVEAVAGEEHGEPHRGLARRRRLAGSSPQTASDSSQGRAIDDADAAEERAAGELMSWCIVGSSACPWVGSRSRHGSNSVTLTSRPTRLRRTATSSPRISRNCRLRTIASTAAPTR